MPFNRRIKTLIQLLNPCKKGKGVDSFPPVADIIDYEKLGRQVGELNKIYANNEPFPHVVIDDFITPEALDTLLAAFPVAESGVQKRDNTAQTDGGKRAQFRKVGVKDESKLEPLIRQFLLELNSGRFLSLVSQISGVDALIPDPGFRGGGTHQTLRGGLLRVHADFNKHPVFQLDRRINFLLYLNKDWDESYGGNLELWDENVTACQKRILPIAGRVVIFSTTSTSFHGHPEPLNCPEDMTRKSIAMYYYTNGRPESEGSEAHATLWPNMPSEG